MTLELTRDQRKALELLVNQGGARYGTQIVAMRELKALGLCMSHDTGKCGAGRWTWRPTPEGVALLRSKP